MTIIMDLITRLNGSHQQTNKRLQIYSTITTRGHYRFPTYLNDQIYLFIYSKYVLTLLTASKAEIMKNLFELFR